MRRGKLRTQRGQCGSCTHYYGALKNARIQREGKNHWTNPFVTQGDYSTCAQHDPRNRVTVLRGPSSTHTLSYTPYTPYHMPSSGNAARTLFFKVAPYMMRLYIRRHRHKPDTTHRRSLCKSSRSPRNLLHLRCSMPAAPEMTAMTQQCVAHAT